MVDGDVAPLPASLVTALPEAGTDEQLDAAAEAGQEALRAGAVAVVVLAGGMATRFGGAREGARRGVDGRSFLELKLASGATCGDALGVEVPVAVMTSFSTDRQTRAFVAEHELGTPHFFTQFVAPRLEPEAPSSATTRARIALRPRATATSSRRLRVRDGEHASCARGARTPVRLERRQPRSAARPRRRRNARARGHPGHDGGGGARR